VPTFCGWPTNYSSHTSAILKENVLTAGTDCQENVSRKKNEIKLLNVKRNKPD
jgi:hypothetical protein